MSDSANLLVASYVQTGVVLVSGLFVFAVYFLTRAQELRNAARVVYLEIKNSEQQISNLRASGVATEDTVVLPTNSWTKYSHLFIRKLDFEDYFILDNFYTACSRVQVLLEEIRLYHDDAVKEKGIELQRRLLGLIDPNSDNPREQYLSRRERLLAIAHEETYVFAPNFPKERLGRYLNTIRPVIGTTCFDKIKRISGIK